MILRLPFTACTFLWGLANIENTARKKGKSIHIHKNTNRTTLSGITTVCETAASCLVVLRALGFSWEKTPPFVPGITISMHTHYKWYSSIDRSISMGIYIGGGPCTSSAWCPAACPSRSSDWPAAPRLSCSSAPASRAGPSCWTCAGRDPSPAWPS